MVLASMEALVKKGKFAEVGSVQGHEKPHRAVMHAINAQRSASCRNRQKRRKPAALTVPSSCRQQRLVTPFTSHWEWRLQI